MIPNNPLRKSNFAVSKVINPLPFKNLNILVVHFGVFIPQRWDDVPFKVLEEPNPPFSKSPCVMRSDVTDRVDDQSILCPFLNTFRRVRDTR